MKGENTNFPFHQIESTKMNVRIPNTCNSRTEKDLMMLVLAV
jgi:hypothetical protein